MLTLTLLGPFRAELEGRPGPLRLPTQKSVALLAYLALNREGPVSRDYLAGLLWNDVPLRQGRHSLRQELTHIRTALGSSWSTYLHADRSTVDLHHERVVVDVERLTDLVAQQTSDSLRDACALYNGELLKGLNTRERAFERWLDGARGNSNRLAIIALECRLKELTDLRDRTEGLTVARQLLAVDPDNDAPYRCMMLLFGTGHEHTGKETASRSSGERRQSMPRESQVAPRSHDHDN